MRIILDDALKFELSIAYDGRSSDEPKRRSDFYQSALPEWERSGLAMRYLDAHGRLAWKAAPKLLERKAEMELEAREEDDNDNCDNDDE